MSQNWAQLQRRLFWNEVHLATIRTALNVRGCAYVCVNHFCRTSFPNAINHFGDEDEDAVTSKRMNFNCETHIQFAICSQGPGQAHRHNWTCFDFCPMWIWSWMPGQLEMSGVKMSALFGASITNGRCYLNHIKINSRLGHDDVLTVFGAH